MEWEPRMGWLSAYRPRFLSKQLTFRFTISSILRVSRMNGLPSSILNGAQLGSLQAGAMGSVIRFVVNPTALGLVPQISSIFRGSEIFSNFLKPIDRGSTKVDRLQATLLVFSGISLVGVAPCISFHWNVLERANFLVAAKSFSSQVSAICTDGRQTHCVCALGEGPVIWIRLHQVIFIRYIDFYAELTLQKHNPISIPVILDQIFRRYWIQLNE